MQTLADLLLTQLRKVYDVELQHLTLLPHLARASTSPELRQAFDHHRVETRAQLARLDEIFAALGAEARGESCLTMEGLVRECQAILDAEQPLPIRDAALIAAAQCIEHHEIAEYGTCRTYAQQLGFANAPDLLQRTLDEESKMDSRLTLVAEGSLFHSGVNSLAGEVIATPQGLFTNSGGPRWG